MIRLTPLLGGRRTVLGVLCVLVLVSTVYATSGERSRLTLPEVMLHEVLYPFQGAFAFFTREVRSFLEPFFRIRGLAEEHGVLSQQVRDLTSEVVELQEYRAENIRLRRLLEFSRLVPGEVVAAQVIGRDPTNWRSSVTINRGKRHGVTEGLPIVTPAGLVGTVTSVSHSVSRVALLTDAGAAVGGLVQRTRDLLVVEGSPDGSELLRFKALGRDVDVREGDAVLSSGLGGIYPKGVVIGTVVRVEKVEYGVSILGEIRSAVDFARLEEVLVILSMTEDGLEDLSQEEGPPAEPEDRAYREDEERRFDAGEGEVL